MNKNSTLTGKLIMILAIFTLLPGFSANAGSGSGKAPKFKFSNPTLVSGIGGQIGAKYLFKNVYNNKDAYVTIENIVGADIVIENGGEVKTIPLVKGFSTSDLIKKIKGS